MRLSDLFRIKVNLHVHGRMPPRQKGNAKTFLSGVGGEEIEHRVALALAGKKPVQLADAARMLNAIRQPNSGSSQKRTSPSKAPSPPAPPPMKLNEASYLLNTLYPRLNVSSAMKVRNVEKMTFPTDKLYPEKSDKDLIRLVDKLVHIRSRPELARQLDMNAPQLGKLGLNLEGKDLQTKTKELNELKKRALAGEYAAFHRILRLAYYPDKDVRGLVAGAFPELYAHNPKLTAAMCTHIMARWDPELKTLLLEEYGREIETELLLGGREHKLPQLTFRGPQTRKATERILKWRKKKPRSLLNRSARLVEEDARITARLRVLSKQQRGMALIALGALADGYDRNCVMAAHLSLLDRKACEYLGVSSPDQIFNPRRPITKPEIEAQKHLYPGNKAEYHGMMQIGDKPESSTLMRAIARRHVVEGRKNGAWKVVTLAGGKGKTATLIARNGKVRLIAEKRFNEDDPELKAWLHGIRKAIETAAGLNNIKVKVPGKFRILPTPSGKCFRDFFGAWLAHQLNKDEKAMTSRVRDVADRYTKHFVGLGKEDQRRENDFLRLKYVCDRVRTSQVKPEKYVSRRDLPAPQPLSDGLVEAKDRFLPWWY